MRIQAAVSRTGLICPQIEDLVLDEPRSDEVRVRVVATGICHTDLNCHAGIGVPVPKPIVLGHEGAGIVEALGTGIRNLAIGDAVVLSGGSCGVCPSCRAARPTYCRDTMKLSFGGMRADGSSPLTQRGERIAGAFFAQSSFATHAVVPERTAVKIAKDLPLHLMGPLGCGIITGAGAVMETFEIRPGDSLVVFGVGSVGLAAIMAAQLAGASSIVAVDLDQSRLDMAASLGATHALVSNAATLNALREIEPFGFNFSFNTTTAPFVYAMALDCLSMEGTAGFVTRPHGEWSPNIAALLAGGRKLQGILGGGAAPQIFIPRLIDFWRAGRFPFDRLISVFPFENIADAWAAAANGSALKPVLLMP